MEIPKHIQDLINFLEEQQKEIDKLQRTIDGLLETGTSKLTLKLMTDKDKELREEVKILEEREVLWSNKKLQLEDELEK